MICTWFMIRWMICTKLNNLYLKTMNVFWLRWNTCTVIEWFEQFNETYSWKISTGRFPRNSLSHEDPDNEHCPVRKPP